MSHLACPLCGKYAPLSTFDPDSLDLDLQVASFRGLGRGKGFAPPERTSIFGDDIYTPLVAGRVISLCEMFIKEGIIQPQDLLSKVGLDEKFRSSAMYIPRVEYDLAQLSIAEYNKALQEANARIGSLSASLTTTNSELENCARQRVAKFFGLTYTCK